MNIIHRQQLDLFLHAPNNYLSVTRCCKIHIKLVIYFLIHMFILNLLWNIFYRVAVVTLQMSSLLFWYWDYLIILIDNWYFCSCFKCFHSLPDARRSALLFSFNAVTAFVCPFRTSIRFPLITENTTIVVSSDPLIMMSSSEVIVRQRTAPRCSLKRFLKMYDSQSRFITHVQAVILFIPNSVNRSRRSSHMFTRKYTTYKVLNTEKLYFATFIVILYRLFT